MNQENAVHQSLKAWLFWKAEFFLEFIVFIT
jgi:hypothetical protein